MLSNPGTEEAPHARHTSEGNVMPTLQTRRRKRRNQGWLAPPEMLLPRMLFFHLPGGPPTRNPNKQSSNGNTGCTPASKAGWRPSAQAGAKASSHSEAACTRADTVKLSTVLFTFSSQCSHLSYAYHPNPWEDYNGGFYCPH